MFRNYLVTALRNIARHKLYSFINIAGLAVGLACVIFVILFVRDQLSYDTWVPGTQNLYRVEMTLQVPGRPPLAMAMIPFPMPQAMRDEIPGVTGMTRIFQSSMTLMVGDRQFLENVFSVDPGFFKLIRLPLIAGDPDNVFRQPQSLVLSQSAARKYFGDANPIGRVITTARSDCAGADKACHAQTISLKVTGVMRDLPHNTHLTGDVFLPNTSIADHVSQDTKHQWFNESGWGYVRLAPGTDPNGVIARMGPLLDRAVTPELKKFGIAARGSRAYAIHLTRFTQVHLSSSGLQFNMAPPGSWLAVYGALTIGALILLMACFNFMNLAAARAMLRAREVALRKTLGANRRQLAIQFLGEAVFTALLALLLGAAIVEILMPAFDRLLGSSLAFDYVSDWPVLVVLVGVAVAAGFISGSYPATILSSFRPATTLRTYGSSLAGAGLLRNFLVVIQFAVSIGLGIAASVVFSQINHARKIDLGFRHDNIVYVAGGLLTGEQREAMMQVLRTNPGVIEVGTSSPTPFQSGQFLSLVQIPGQSDTISLNRIAIYPTYPKVYGILLLAGRLLSETRSDDRLHSLGSGGDPLNDGLNIIINEAAARRLGFSPQEAVGKIILFDHNHVRIAGVLADAKVRGAREPIKPTAYAYAPNYEMDFAIHVRPDMIPQTLNFIDRTWHAFSPNVAIQRLFLGDIFDHYYRADERQGAMLGASVLLAIFIACLGMFGLAAFTAGQRTREIGLRKTFGAGTGDIVRMLLWQFSIPVLIANAIAWPVAWYYLQDWLQGFAYRIPLSPLYFLGAGGIALVIAWATVFVHALRVASANPIHALRYE